MRDCCDYANKLSRFGLSSYPEIVQRYREKTGNAYRLDPAAGSLSFCFRRRQLASPFSNRDAGGAAKRLGSFQYW